MKSYLVNLQGLGHGRVPGNFCDRGNRSQMFYKIDALKNFAKFSETHLCWSHFSIGLQAFRLASLLKRDSSTSVSL